MDRLWPLIAILIFSIIGFISKRVTILDISQRIDYTTTYHNDFVELVNKFLSTKRVDAQLYSDLMQRVNKMQSELGSDGVMAVMYDPLKGIKTTNYQMLINFLPEINEYFDMWDVLGMPNSIMHQRFISSANTCRDMFLRHNGSLNDLLKDEEKCQFNLFSCLAEGVKVVLWIPMYILISLGLFTGNVFFRWKTKWFPKLIAAFISIIGLIGSLITIIIGWEQFYGMLVSWFGK